MLDNVSVTNVPEPGSLAILALGMLVLGVSRKSNKKVS
jgi:PEP-CTERM motif